MSERRNYGRVSVYRNQSSTNCWNKRYAGGHCWHIRRINLRVPISAFRIFFLCFCSRISMVGTGLARVLENFRFWYYIIPLKHKFFLGSLWEILWRFWLFENQRVQFLQNQKSSSHWSHLASVEQPKHWWDRAARTMARTSLQHQHRIQMLVRFDLKFQIFFAKDSKILKKQS